MFCTFRTLVDWFPVRSVEADWTLQRVNQFVNVTVSTRRPREVGMLVLKIREAVLTLSLTNTFYISSRISPKNGIFAQLFSFREAIL